MSNLEMNINNNYNNYKSYKPITFQYGMKLN